MNIVLGMLLGTLFGFVLERIGAANPDELLRMLMLKDFRLMKIIMGAIGIGMIGLYLGMSLGFIDSAHMSVKATYWGVIFGGLLLGLGWGMSGFCPGTGVVALGSGRKDAVFFVIGGLVGAFLLMLSYSWLESMGWFNNLWGGQVALAANPKFTSLIPMDGTLLAVIIGVIFLLIAAILPSGRRA